METVFRLDRNLKTRGEYLQCDVLLQQKLPLASVGSKAASATKSDQYITSKICVKYEDRQKFETDLPDQLKEAHFPVADHPKLIDEADSDRAFKENVLTPMEQLFDRRFEIKPNLRLQPFELDYALVIEGEAPFLIIEVKQWNSLIDINLGDLPTRQTVIDHLERADLPRYECQGDTFKKNVRFENETRAQFNFRMGLKQLTTYLRALKLEKSYGILTSYCHTYFVILNETQNELQISPVARYCDTDILQRIAKFIYLAFTAERKPIVVTTTLTPQKDRTDDNEEGDSSSKGDRGRKTRMMFGTGEESHRVLRSGGQENTGQERQKNTGQERQKNTGQENTDGQRNYFVPYVVGETLGEGRSGCVLKITNDKGKSFAAKCIGDKRKEDVLSELHNEKVIYKKLKNLQGEVVPLFHCSGYLYNSLYTLVLEYIDGDPICNLELSDEEKEVIVASLDRIHKMGVLHGDIRNENVMINRSKHIYFVDFAMSTECHSTEAFKQEINQLRALLNLDLLP